MNNDFKVKDGVLVEYTGFGNRPTIPEGVKEIAEGVFKGKELLEVYLPKSLEKIGKGAFENAFSHPFDLEIPENVTVIEKDAFKNANLNSLKLNEKIAIIGEGAFKGNAIEQLEIPRSMRYIGEAAFSYNNIKGILNIPEGLERIGNFAFANNRELERVELPDTTKTIGKHAFANCTSLNSLYLNDGIEKIGAGAFMNCSLKELFVPSSVVHIEERAFESNNIYALKIDKGIQTIGASAFANNHLQEVKLPSSVVAIYKGAFEENRISKLDLGKVEYIAENAFRNNTIEKLRVPDQTKVILDSAFENNTLKKVSVRGDIDTITLEAFKNNSIVDFKMRGTGFNFVNENGVDLNKFAFARAFGESDLVKHIVNAAETLKDGALQLLKLKERAFIKGLDDVEPFYKKIGQAFEKGLCSLNFFNKVKESRDFLKTNEAEILKTNLENALTGKEISKVKTTTELER